LGAAFCCAFCELAEDLAHLIVGAHADLDEAQVDLWVMSAEATFHDKRVANSPAAFTASLALSATRSFGSAMPVGREEGLWSPVRTRLSRVADVARF